MNAKHTPGPWRVTGAMTKYVEARIRDGWVQEVAAVGPTEKDHGYGPQQEANARLIAAAPDLLEALESVWLWMENQADGQSKGGHATFDLMMLREQRDIARIAIAKATGGAA